MNSILLSILLALAVGESQTFKVDDRTEAKVTVQQEAVKVDIVCKESNMAFVKNHYYKKGRWNLFTGENVDVWFSPHSWKTHKVVYPPNYRVMTNPSSTYLNAYFGVPRPSKSFKNVVTLKDDCWTVEWELPYAALGTSDFTKLKKTKVYPPSQYWAFQFNRRSETSGKASFNKSPVYVIEIPQNVIAPYRQIMMYGFSAKNGAKAGESVIDFTLKNNVAKAFDGKVKVVLLEGKEETLLKEEKVGMDGNTVKKFTINATLPEKAVKFGVKVYVYNQAGTLVRVSRDLAIDNPWVAF